MMLALALNNNASVTHPRLSRC